MYQPTHFKEDRLDVQHALIRAHPLGLLISNDADGIIANPIPFLLDVEASQFGTLQCHVARANAQWRSINDQNVLIVFQGVDTYVTPSWYQTKRETGKVVPTWNYAMVQARGTAKLIDDGAWLAQQIAALTNQHEGNRAAPWAVTDAPDSYIASQIRGIVGIEITITAIEGKWKVSQNRTEADRRGVADGVASDGAAPEMADLVREFGGLG
jgi:transcriptional regulator